MSGVKKILFAAAIIFALVTSSKNAHAQASPDFPFCFNPQGTVVASYSSGTHGIPGDGNVYEGSDTVYAFNDKQLIQCFCPPTGTGIQTNWWKFSELSQDQVNNMVAAGWVYIPDGSAWGLDNAPYLAKNYRFECVFGGKGGGGGESQVTTSSSGGGQVLGIGGGEVLGLASTGNKAQIYGFLAFGAVLVYCAFKLRDEK